MCWCCLALCCSVPLWYETGPQKRPRRWWVGSKGSLRGILTSHLGPSFSHLCGGCKAPEQVSPSRWKSQLSVRELWPAVSLKPSFLGFWRKSCWTYIHPVCFRTREPNASAHSHNVFPAAEVFAGAEHCHVLNTWGKRLDDLLALQDLSDIMCMCVLSNRKLSQDLKHGIPTAHVESLLTVICFAFCRLNGPHGSSVLSVERWTVTSGWDENGNVWNVVAVEHRWGAEATQMNLFAVSFGLWNKNVNNICTYVFSGCIKYNEVNLN